MTILIESGFYSTVAISTMIPCSSQQDAERKLNILQNPYIVNLYIITEAANEKID